MPITTTVSSTGRRVSRAVVTKATWATVTPDHSVSDSIFLCGMLHGIVTVPGSPAPSDGYNIRLLDGDVDLLNSAGLARDSDVIEWGECLVSSVHPVPVDGSYVLRISEADSDTAGSITFLLAT